MLHFTAGSIEGDILTMTKANSFVSVPFVIARDGTIYQLFSSGHWAYSLGMKASDGDNTNHKLHKSLRYLIGKNLKKILQAQVLTEVEVVKKREGKR